MSKRKNKRINVGPWIAVGALALGGLAFYVQQNKVDLNSSPLPTSMSGTSLDTNQAKSSIKPQLVKVMRAKPDGDHAAFETTTSEVPPGMDHKVFALNSFLKQIPAVNGGSVLDVSVSNGEALISVNKGLATTFGMEDEKTILDGIARTLGTYPDIKTFRLTFEGQRIDTLGHADLTDAMPVIRETGVPEPKPTSATP
jgi:hypothetical protein